MKEENHKIHHLAKSQATMGQWLRFLLILLIVFLNSTFFRYIISQQSHFQKA